MKRRENSSQNRVHWITTRTAFRLRYASFSHPLPRPCHSCRRDSLSSAISSAHVPLSDAIKALEDDKAEDIVTIDLRGRSAIADHMVIASGRSARQVGAIAEHLAEKFKADTGRSARIEGKEPQH